MKEENIYHNLYSLIPFLPKPLYEEDMENLKDTVDTFVARLKRYNEDGKFDGRIDEILHEFEKWKENPNAYNRNHNIAGAFDKENEEVFNMVNNRSIKPRRQDEAINENKKTKREKKIKIIKKAIIGGTIVAVGLTGVILTTNYIQNKKQENLASNVCVEYTVEEGIGNKKLDDMFYEYGYASYAVSGADRNLSSNSGSPFEGDVIVGRTSEEKANELVEDHNAEIISPEEAISLLEENKSLVGEFKKTADGDNSFNWYAVEKAKTKL